MPTSGVILRPLPNNAVPPNGTRTAPTLGIDWGGLQGLRPGGYSSLPGYGQPAPGPAPLPSTQAGPPAGGLGGIPGGSDIIGTGNVPGYGASNSQLSTVIANLLNPNDAQANADVTLHGAENAVANGTVGSGLAGETTGRMRQADIERRAQLGANLLFGQENVDLRNKIESGQLTLEQMRLALQDRIQSGQLSIEAARAIWNHYGGGGGGGGYPGGGVHPGMTGTGNVGAGLPPLPSPGSTGEGGGDYYMPGGSIGGSSPGPSYILSTDEQGNPVGLNPDMLNNWQLMSTPWSGYEGQDNPYGGGLEADDSWLTDSAGYYG